MGRKIKLGTTSFKRFKSFDAVIVSAVRTPIGTFLGDLSTVPAPKLGAAAIKGAVERAGIKGEDVEELYMGNVLQAGQGQAPARQAAIFSGLPEKTICTTVNKVCASGMKSIMLATQSIRLGDQHVLVAGGMENMSLSPYYVQGARSGFKFGNQQLLDALLHDGLTDVYNKFHMGMCGENTAKKHNFTREQQDEYAIMSYKRSAAAWDSGAFDSEIVPVVVNDKSTVVKDSEYSKINFDKLKTLRPAFDKEGTITAANASTLNDGASALVIMSSEKAKALGVKPLAKIRGYGDAEIAPIDFPVAPAYAVPKALAHAGVSVGDIDLWEFNEAFSVVALANMKLLNLEADKVNVNGGAVSLGHPIGSSGARIVVTLLHALRNRGKTLGCAAICNGGGGASAIVIETVDE